MIGFFIAIAKLVTSGIGFSLIFAAILAYKRAWLLPLLPLLPYTGLWVLEQVKNPDYFFIATYMEFVIAFFLFFTMIVNRRLDGNRLFLMVLPLTSLTGLVAAKGNFAMSIFIMTVLFLSVGIYDYFTMLLSRINSAQLTQIVDCSAIIWIGLHFFMRYWIAESQNMDILAMRGGFYGTNHVLQILLCLLPLIGNRIVLGLVFVTIILSFSRGGYIAIITYFFMWSLFISKKRVAISIVVLIMLSLLILISPLQEPIADFVDLHILSRISGTSAIFSEDTINRLAQDQRWEIAKMALDISEEKMYMGGGLGAFAWMTDEIGYQYRFSNAHNLYLTALSEGGILYLFALLTYLGVLLKKSFCLDKKIFAAMVTFCVYGLFSAQLYDNTSNRFTAIDYYYLLFIFAYLGKLKNMRQKFE